MARQKGRAGPDGGAATSDPNAQAAQVDSSTASLDDLTPLRAARARQLLLLLEEAEHGLNLEARDHLDWWLARGFTITARDQAVDDLVELELARLDVCAGGICVYAVDSDEEPS